MTAHPLDATLQRVSTLLAVSDLARSAAYYRETWGFHEVEAADGIVLLERAGFFLYLVSPSPPTPDKPSITLSPPPARDTTPVNIVFRVSDCLAAHSALSDAGVRFLTPPAQPPWGGWRCFTRDPDGYLIEVEEP